VLYLVWGEQHAALMERSLQSLRAVHPELPVHLHTLPAHASLLEKAAMFDLSPFEQTLYLDADTVVLDRLDFGFECAARDRLAMCICECPWARRYAGLSGETIEYNTGVVFFSQAAQPIFDAWKHWATRLDSSVCYHHPNGGLGLMPANDQASFAKAVVETGFNPRVLPQNWNFRPAYQNTFFGPLKIWHDRSMPSETIFSAVAEQRGEQKLIKFFNLR